MRRLLPLLLALASGAAWAKPIAYPDGWTFLYDYGPHMEEAQVFAAPNFQSSLGAGWVRVKLPAQGSGHNHGTSTAYRDHVDIEYLRLNLLAERWNFTDAQANIYLWGGLGTSNGGTREGPDTVPNGGFQVDAESRRYYAALKSDWHSTFGFTWDMSTLQLGIAPYLHDYNGVATWLVVQGHHMDGSLHREDGAAGLVRVFWRGIWVEAGADLKGKPLALLMLNL